MRLRPVSYERDSPLREPLDPVTAVGPESGACRSRYASSDTGWVGAAVSALFIDPRRALG